ncbi:MAG TPA: hypothetical protein VHO27_00025 [Angustibacter sp.]|nr:hypothetical protein [Angustibacter sp.]
MEADEGFDGVDGVCESGRASASVPTFSVGRAPAGSRGVLTTVVGDVVAAAAAFAEVCGVEGTALATPVAEPTDMLAPASTSAPAGPTPWAVACAPLATTAAACAALAAPADVSPADAVSALAFTGSLACNGCEASVAVASGAPVLGEPASSERVSSE